LSANTTELVHFEYYTKTSEMPRIRKAFSNTEEREPCSVEGTALTAVW